LEGTGHFNFALTLPGYRDYRQRLEIFREVAGTETHPDAETIFRAVQQRMPTVSLDTVYRTLWVLHDLGLVTTLGPQGDRVRFDANLDRHHHYVCVCCGLVRDFESERLNDLRVPGAVTQLGSVMDAHVEVRGVCATCHQEPETSKQRGKSKKRSTPSALRGSRSPRPSSPRPPKRIGPARAR
jgi:Fur family peroxide stress response transcriptional regulator